MDIFHILAYHDAGLGIEIHPFIAERLPALQGFAVDQELYAFLIFHKRGFGQELEVGPEHVVVGMGAVGMDHAGICLDEAVLGGDDVVDGAVFVRDIHGVKAVGVVGQGEAGRVLLGFRGVQIGREDPRIGVFKNVFDVFELGHPAGGVRPFQVRVVIVDERAVDIEDGVS